MAITRSRSELNSRLRRESLYAPLPRRNRFRMDGHVVSLFSVYSTGYLKVYRTPHGSLNPGRLLLRLEIVPAFALDGAELERRELLACAVCDRTRDMVAGGERAHARGCAGEDEVTRLGAHDETR